MRWIHTPARIRSSRPRRSTFNQTASTFPIKLVPNSEPAGGQAKDLSFKWPAGLIGNPEVSPRCTAAEFADTKDSGESKNACPASTAVGVATLVVNEPSLLRATTFTVPLFNLEPEVGEPARFGFYIVEANAPVYIDTAVRTGGDYGITVTTHNITQTAGFLSAHVTVWGCRVTPATTPSAVGVASLRLAETLVLLRVCPKKRSTRLRSCRCPRRVRVHCIPAWKATPGRPGACSVPLKARLCRRWVAVTGCRLKARSRWFLTGRRLVRRRG